MLDTSSLVLFSLRFRAPGYTHAIEVALLATSRSIALMVGELQAKENL